MMVGPEGRAVGVEHIPELVVASIENIKRSAAACLLNEGSLSVHVAGKFYYILGMFIFSSYKFALSKSYVEEIYS